jgi:hypothetical protein
MTSPGKFVHFGLDRWGQVGQQKHEIAAVIRDLAVMVVGDRHPDHVGDVGVEGVLGAVTEGNAFADRLVL